MPVIADRIAAAFARGYARGNGYENVEPIPRDVEEAWSEEQRMLLANFRDIDDAVRIAHRWANRELPPVTADDMRSIMLALAALPHPETPPNMGESICTQPGEDHGRQR